MVNVKVIKAKNAIISFGIIAFLLMSLIKIIVIGKNKIKEVSLVPLIEDTIILANGNSLKEFKSMDRDNTEKILASELQMSKYIKEKEIPKEVPENNEVKIAKEEEKIEEAKTGVGTEIISGGNINNKYTNEYNGVQIKNESKYELTEDMLTPNINLENKKDIIIYHTHTCESYTQSAGFEYTPSGNFRTTDLNFSVVRAGRELKNRLTNYGFNVLHNETYHDYPAYSGSYNRSLTSIKNDLVANPNTQIVIDLHRDAVGLTHKDWVQNLKFAIKIVQKGNELYPGLFKPIMVRNSRYNQHVAKAATIMEIGATGNTMEQCLNSMKYLSKVMDEALK